MTAILLLIPLLALAANNSVNDACKRLCNVESECVRKCVSHAELFELQPEFINATTDFTPKVEDRMKALRTGANVDILEICKKSGWSLDNQMTCLRAYPTPDVMRNCKKLSPLQDEQVRCVRDGKTSARVEACSELVPGTDKRLRCVEMQISEKDAHTCKSEGGDSHARIQCLERREQDRIAEARHQALDSRIRDARGHDRQQSSNRAPASISE